MPFIDCALCNGAGEYWSCLLGYACDPDGCWRECGCVEIERPWTEKEVWDGHAY